MSSRIRYDRLITERASQNGAALDRLDPLAIARLMSREDRRAVRAVARVLPQVAAGVRLVVGALRRGGHLFFVGAGTSGRLGVLEAAECPPTFGTPPRLVQAVMAGGRSAVFRSREGAEDDGDAARREVERRVRGGDVVVGVSASGVTPFVRAALVAARARGASRILVSCNPAPRGRSLAEVVVTPTPGPEVLAGSTRLKAGTATKLVLNMLTTASMAGLGRVHGNRMIDLEPRSLKLRERALRLVEELGGVRRREARSALEAAGGRVRVAIVIARARVPASEARRRLATAGGSLRDALETGRETAPRNRRGSSATDGRVRRSGRRRR